MIHTLTKPSTALLASVLLSAIFLPFSARAWVDYGAYYYTPAPHSQMYYQPMYAYSYAPVLNHQVSNYQPQNVYQSSYQPSYGGGYGHPNYGSMPFQQYGGYGYQQNYGSQPYSYPQYNTYTPQYSYGYSQNSYSQWGPSGYGYPTGDTAPWIGGQLCEFPDYDGRALCGSNPNQWIYDPWTGSWY